MKIVPDVEDNALNDVGDAQSDAPDDLPDLVLHPSRNINQPECYNSETGKSYCQIEACHDMVEQKKPKQCFSSF